MEKIEVKYETDKASVKKMTEAWKAWIKQNPQFDDEFVGYVGDQWVKGKVNLLITKDE